MRVNKAHLEKEKYGMKTGQISLDWGALGAEMENQEDLLTGPPTKHREQNLTGPLTKERGGALTCVVMRNRSQVSTCQHYLCGTGRHIF